MLSAARSFGHARIARLSVAACLFCACIGGAAAVDCAASDVADDHASVCDPSAREGSNASAVARARALVQPSAELTERGELEGADFWEEHESLLEQAWAEVPRLQPLLYTFGPAFEERYLGPDLRAAAAAARRGEGEGAVKRLFHEVAQGTRGVWASTALFTQAFRDDMLEELSHVNQLEIPMRRPNGMNRYGMILDQVGFEAMISGLVDRYIRPLAETLFPDVVGSGDAAEHYAFSIRYRVGEDVELAKHRDQAVATLNLCLGRTFSGGALRFFGDGRTLGHHLVSWATPREKASSLNDSSDEVEFVPGMAVFHRGQHQHQALELLDGDRTNIIIWLFAEYGVVRVAPYLPSEQLTAAERWRQ